MPSPLNTPTNERLPSQLWTIKSQSEDITGLPFTKPPINSDIHINIESNSLRAQDTQQDMEQKTNSDSKLSPNCGQQFNIDEINDETNKRIQLSTTGHISDSRRISRIGLNLDLSLNPSNASVEVQTRKRPQLNFGMNAFNESTAERIDVTIPLEKQGWFHGYISRIDAENLLRPMKEGSYLVRKCESTKQIYSLSLKSVRGFMHIRIMRQNDGKYIFGTSNMSFNSIPEILNHYCFNKLPIRGAEHMSLLYPVIDQLL